MITAWTKHLRDQEEIEDFQKYIKSSVKVLDRLNELLEEEKRTLDRSETDLKSFDQPNWDYKQAYKNGYRACLQVIQKLIQVT